MITTLIGHSDTLWVDFKVPQFYPDLQTDSYITIRRLQAAISPMAGNSQINASNSYQAKILASNTVINTANRSRHYRASVNKNQFPLSPNAIVEVEIPLAQIQSLIAIPATAIQNDHLGQYVYKLVASEDAYGQPAYRAQRAQISIQAQQRQQVFISTGLAVDDIIAAAGAFKLHPGILTYARERISAKTDTNKPVEAQ